LDPGDARPGARQIGRRRTGRRLVPSPQLAADRSHGAPGQRHAVIVWRARHNLRAIATTGTGEGVLPAREEAAELIPPRDGITWRIAGDARLFAGSGYALLLQVSHPSVGAGVTQHSDFKRDPWGRLVRTLDYTSSVVYGGPELAWEVGRRVREMHRRINGVRPDGERYHALEPRPYAWGPATLAEAIVRAHKLFCGPALDIAQD